MQLFSPTLRLWNELGLYCRLITDRQFGNQPVQIGAISKWMYEWVKYPPCCGADPYTYENQDVWLPFSDYYNERLFKYLIYYDNQTDLWNKIVEHY